MMTVPGIKTALLLICISGVSGDVFVYNCPANSTRKLYEQTYNQIDVKPMSFDRKEMEQISNYDFTYTMSTYDPKISKQVPQDVTPFLKKGPFNYLSINRSQLKADSIYEVIVKHRAKNGYNGPKTILPAETQTCFLKIMEYLPAAVILGGFYRTAPFKDIQVISGSVSDGKKLTFSWGCDENMRREFCTKFPLSTSNALRLSATNTKHGKQVEMLLRVQEQGKYYGSEAKQTIRFVANSSEIRTDCVTNCIYGLSALHQPVVLYASCISGCDHVDYTKDFYWTVRTKKFFNYTEHTAGRVQRSFKLMKYALPAGSYEVEVQLKSKLSVGVLMVTFVAAPKIKDCKLNPPRGKAEETVFLLSCQNFETWDTRYYYNLYHRVAGGDPERPEQKLLDSGVWGVKKVNRTLPPTNKGQILILKLTRGSTAFIELPVAGEVFDELPTTAESSLTENVDFLNTNFSRMISSNDPEERRRARDRLIETIDKLNASNIDEKMSKLIEQLKYKIPENVLQIPINSLQEAAKVVLAVVKIETIQESNGDPELAKVVTTACRKVGDRAFDLMKQQTPDAGIKDVATTLNKALNECLETAAQAKPELLHQHDVDFSTPEPNVDENVPTEDYAYYLDHDKQYYKYLEDLKEATFNMINGTAMAAKMRAFTLTEGESPAEIGGQLSKSLVIKDAGAKLLKRRVELEGVRVVPSEDFANDTHSYDILLSSWQTDIMWWNRRGTKVATAIISLQVWHSTCKERVTDFKQPVDIFLTAKNGVFVEQIVEYSFDIPKSYKGMSDDETNYEIQVHRIGLQRGQMLSVKFYNLSAEDHLHAVVTVNKFPTVEDFVTNKALRPNDNILSTVNHRNDSTFTYVAILANRTSAVEGKRITYRLSSVLTTCIKWIALSSKWETACELKEITYRSNSSVMHCQCWNLSVLAGYVQNIKSPRQTVLKVDVELEITVTHVIFYSTVVTLIVYFVLVVFSVIRRKEPIYFLADNNAKHQFAYVVTVKTGWGWSSGTSSNITMRVTGSKTESEPHVLNYPDPKMRLLQQFGHEKYVLTTGSHLGDLEKIELWFDAIGQNPFWNIKIYDMQLHREWVFRVQQYLSLEDGRYYITVQPEKASVPQDEAPRVAKQKSYYKWPSTVNFDRRNYTFMHRTHNWYFWQVESHFSYFKKLTTVLSTILTSYCISVWYVVRPTMQVSDSFDSYYNQVFGWKELSYAVVSSCPIFAVHLCIGWVFRYSRLQIPEEKDDHALPFVCTAACWSILIFFIVCSLTYLIIVGFWIPYYTSLAWLWIAWIGILMGIFVYESVFAFMQTICCRINRESIQKNFLTIWMTIDIQRKYLYARFGEPLLRPYFEHLYHPLKRRAIREKRRYWNMRYRVIAEFEDLFMFGIYIILLYVVILADKDSKVVYGYKNMVSMLKGEHLRSPGIAVVEDLELLLLYINRSLIPTIQPTYWYGNYVLSDPGLMIDARTKYLGVVRLRQQRVHRDQHYCETNEKLKFLNQTCWPEFSMRYAESRKFGYRWGEFTALMIYDRMRSMWEYTPDTDSHTQPYIGAIALYSGGGYIAYLGRTLYNSYANVKKIAGTWWFNPDSKAAFIEFLAYNIDYNIFHAVRISFEQSSTDYFQYNIMVYTVRMLMVESREAQLSKNFFFLFIFWVGLLLVKSSVGAIRNMRGFFTNLWMLIDTFILAMSVTCIVLFGLRFMAIDTYLDTLEEVRNNEFVSYFHLFNIEDFLTIAAALLVCVATIRLWKFLRFSRMFRTMERTLMITAKMFLCFFVGFIVVLTGTSMTMVMLVGQEFHRMHTVMKMIRLLATFALRAIEFKAREILPYHLAMWYLCAYSIFVIISMMTLTMLVVYAYSEAQRQFSGKDEIYTVQDYIIERLFYFNKFCRYKCLRVRGGQSEVQAKVEPKHDKFLYKNCYLVKTRRMALMEHLTHCFIRRKIRNHDEFSEYDKSLMVLICRRSLVRTDDYDDVEVFFKGRVAGKRIQFIDEKHLDFISNVVNLILQDEKVEFEEQRGHEALDECAKVVQRGQETLRKCTLSLKLLNHKMKSAEVEINRLEIKKRPKVHEA